MSATIKPSKAKELDPNFFKNRPSDVNWVLTVTLYDNTEYTFVGNDWKATSRFGEVQNVVVKDRYGHPVFDRPEYREAPNVNAVAYGFDPITGEVRIGILHEARPHADDPDDEDSSELMLFAQTPMGFVNKVIGDDGVAKMENMEAAAAREVSEETGATAVLKITRPSCPRHNPQPTFVATWSDLVFVEVDLLKIENLKLDRGEQIYKAEYISVPTLLNRIFHGAYENISYRSALTNGVLMTFFATYPEFFNAR